jgi:predicted small secreted protein
MKRMMMGLMAAVILTTLIGCNTMHGAGKDVENAGEGIQRTVDKNT